MAGVDRRTWLSLVADEELDAIHRGALAVLERRGMRVEHAEARRLLAQAGADCDEAAQTVRFPAALVEEAVAKVPRRITYGGRETHRDLEFGAGRTFTRNTGGVDLYLDPHTRERRPLLLGDLHDWMVLVDALPHVDYAAVIHPHDAPLATRELHAAAATLRATTKHIFISGVLPRDIDVLWEISCMVQGGEAEARRRPLFCVMESVQTPLFIKELAADVYLACGRRGIPVELNTMPIIGATAPVTVAGALLLCHAELLGAITLCQTAHPGAPIVCAPRVMCMDMRGGFGGTGTMEGVLAGAAGVRMANRCGGLLTNFYGPVTDAVEADTQSAIERTLMAVMPLLAGVSSLAGAGALEAMSVACPVQLVEDDELFGALGRLMRGIKVDERTLAREVIERIGPQGDYLGDEHTLNNFREELYVPTLFERQMREAWEEEGRPSMTDLARERALKLVAEHEPAPLDPALDRELDRLLAKMDREHQ